jgi:hypothetical protein
MTDAQRQAKYRAKQAKISVTVTFNQLDLPALKLLLANPNPALALDPESLERLAAAVFDAAIDCHGTKGQGR